MDGATCLLSVGRDITERKRAEKELADYQEKLVAALASMTDSVCITDASGEAINYNDAFATFHRFRSKAECPTSLSGMRELVEALTPDGKVVPPNERAVSRALRGETAANVEYNMRRTDTGETWIGSYSFSPIRDSEGSIVGTVVVARDITERKQAEAALRESKELLQLFIEQAPVSLAMFDNQMRYLAASRRWKEDNGLGDRELTGLSLYNVVPEIPERWKEAHRRGLAGEVLRAEADRFERADGSVQWIRWEILPWRNAEGGVAGILIFTEDVTQRIEAEEQLRESKELLQVFIKHSPAALVMLDREMRHVAASLSWLEAFSLKEEEIIGRSHYEVIPYIPEHWKEAHRRGMAGEVVRVDAELFKGPDGRVAWTRYEVMPWRKGNGDVGGIIIFGEDITQRIAAQEALERAEEKFRVIFEDAPEGIFQTTPAGILLAVNPAGAIMLGYSPCEDPKSVVHDIARDIWLDPRERARFMEHLKRHGEIEGFSCQLKCKDGAIKWVSISARKICGADGKTLYHQGFIEDLTSRMAAEEARRNAEQKFREIFEDAPEGIFQVSPEGRALAVNPAAAEMLGYESADEAVAAIQDAAQDLWVYPEDRARFLALIEQQGTLRDFQCQLKRKDGKPIWVSSTEKKVTGPDGKTICYQGFNQDITEQKRLEAALRANSRELQLLSEINNALVHAKTEKDLLRECCRIMVETGGYRAAWVGFAGEGPDKPIVTIADCGFEEGFLEGINLTWAETEHEDGPVGRSLRTGEVQVEEDICADPLVHSWRTEAEKVGHRMAIALPFRLTDGAIASLAVFGETPGIRTGSERRLMEQIASDIAYGIDTQRAEIARTRYQEDLRTALEQTIHVIAETVDQRDPYTAGHERRVADLCMRIAQKLGLPEDRTHGLHLAASIHDLGKIGIPAEILSKPGLLTPTQFNLLKEHVQLGYDILKNVAFPWPIAEMILQHHERLDGSGYPRGLKADAISLEARILAVADVVEAMSSHRPYRASKGIGVALDEILAQRGTLYDAHVADACARIFREDGYEFPAQAS